jgi:hypothetical protein
MESSSYEYVELRVAYPGHPVVLLIDGIDDSGTLKRNKYVADAFLNRRERFKDGKQERVYRLPRVTKIWEVNEEIKGHERQRYVIVFGGALHRLTYHAVASILRGQMTIDEAVSSCSHLAVGPDYADTWSEDDD